MMKFDIKNMAKTAFQNKNQKKEDTMKLGGNTDIINKNFNDLKSLLNTLPKNAIKTLDQFVAKHKVILQSVLPSSFKKS